MMSSLSFLISEHGEFYEELPEYMESGRLSDSSTFFMSVMYKSFLVLYRGLYLRYQLKRKRYLAMNIIFVELLIHYGNDYDRQGAWHIYFFLLTAFCSWPIFKYLLKYFCVRSEKSGLLQLLHALLFQLLTIMPKQMHSVVYIWFFSPVSWLLVMHIKKGESRILTFFVCVVCKFAHTAEIDLKPVLQTTNYSYNS